MTCHAPTVERPAHVSPDAVYHFDYHRDEGLFVDPHQRLLGLIEEAPPLFWTPYNGGHWMALGYEEAFHILRDTETFSSAFLSAEGGAGVSTLPDGRHIPRLTPIFVDPPLHAKLRAPLQRVFSPKTVMKLSGDIEALVASLLDAIAQQGSCDFLSAVIEPLPVRIFLRIMGLPDGRIAEFRALVSEILKPVDHDVTAQAMIFRRIADAMAVEIADRRHNPRDDLISMLWSSEIDGAPMTLDLMEDYCSLLFIAGLDTVINVMAHGVRHLASHPDLQNELRANPDRIGEATEELMRRYSISSLIRRVRCDTEFAGCVMQQGDIVIIDLAAADLDPRKFPHPAAVDLTRENKTHLIFGAGPHRCVGSHLARIEINALYRGLLKRLPAFRLDPEKRPVFRAGNILSVTSLPIRWD